VSATRNLLGTGRILMPTDMITITTLLQLGICAKNNTKIFPSELATGINSKTGKKR